MDLKKKKKKKGPVLEIRQGVPIVWRLDVTYNTGAQSSGFNCLKLGQDSAAARPASFIPPWAEHSGSDPLPRSRPAHGVRQYTAS